MNNVTPNNLTYSDYANLREQLMMKQLEIEELQVRLISLEMAIKILRGERVL